MPVSEAEFRSALSRFPSGVTVVTTRDAAGHLHGITVSAFCSVSLAPPMVLICIEKATASHDSFITSGVFVVNVLHESQQDLSQHFATPLEDKFSSVEYELNTDGVPVLSNALASIECRLRHSYDGGDHTIFVGAVENAIVGEGDPLVYFHHNYAGVKS